MPDAVPPDSVPPDSVPPDSVPPDSVPPDSSSRGPGSPTATPPPAARPEESDSAGADSAGADSAGADRAGTDSARRTAQVVADALAELDVDVQREGDDAFLATLPGERRYRTLVWLVVGAHELLVESFVCRQPDENAMGVYRYLLQRNASLRTVAYALDGVGDIHLVGRLPLHAVTVAELNTLLGVVLETSDRDFNAILERGFASAIRREWAWRVSRGDSVKNLHAFRHLIES